MLGFSNILLLAQETATEQSVSLSRDWWIVIGVTAAVIGALLAFSYTTRAGIIARATTKEAVRQPVFGLLLAIGLVLLVLNTYLPFFSLGEDVKMLKDCGLATILISALLLAVWTSSTSIAAEIEGKTAMTLLSKPINRRQFVVGKYIGIVQAVLLLMVPLTLTFLVLIFYKIGYDAREASMEAPGFRERFVDVAGILPGLALIFVETAIITSISVAISTRLPMVINMVTCFAIFVIGHLTPILVQSEALGLEFVKFVAKLIAVAVPTLDYLDTKAAVATGVVVPPEYLGTAALYGALYCTAMILFAFILFEDRDLA